MLRGVGAGASQASPLASLLNAAAALTQLRSTSQRLPAVLNGPSSSDPASLTNPGGASAHALQIETAPASPVLTALRRVLPHWAAAGEVDFTRGAVGGGSHKLPLPLAPVAGGSKRGSGVSPLRRMVSGPVSQRMGNGSNGLLQPDNVPQSTNVSMNGGMGEGLGSI